MARSGKSDRRDRDRGRSREESELIEKLVGINRVAKVVKGGRRFGFAALVTSNSPRSVAARRGKRVGDLLGRRGEAAVEVKETA